MAVNEYLSIEHVSRTFITNGSPLRALDDINFTVKQGEFIGIVGGSGCGKSTLLRTISGIDPDHEGRVLVEGVPVTAPSKDRGIIFQEHRLFPWLTVQANVEFALNGITKAEKKALAKQYIDLVGLTGFEKAYPHQLSGGMAQRAGIARALVNQPRLLLLDEPFGALDAFTKMQMQQETLNLKQKLNSTMVLVTHDIEEAVFLADRVIVLSPRPGRIQRIIPVNLLYPRNRNQYEFTQVRKEIYNELIEEPAMAEDYAI